MAIGRVLHIGVDLVLVSVVLAGIRRSAGYTPALSPDMAVQRAARAYLDVGERIFDEALRRMAGSAFVKRA